MEVKTIQKYSGRTLSYLIQLAQKNFNSWVKKRDTDEFEMFTCISCGSRKPAKEGQAGHYLSAGHNQVVRLEEDNCHLQCVRCNLHLHGNQANYRMGLIEKIGKERVEALEQRAKWPGFKHDRFTLIDIITTYSEKFKHL